MARPGFSGDGGPATAAELNAPRGVAVDASGNLYIADALNNRIRKVSSDGIITTVAGNGSLSYSGDGGLAADAQLSGPRGLAVDGAGNLFIADFDNNTVRKISASGIITTVAGNGVAGFSGDGGPATSAQLNGPWGVAVDRAGNLFIADSANNRVRRVSSSGDITTVAGNGSSPRRLVHANRSWGRRPGDQRRTERIPRAWQSTPLGISTSRIPTTMQSGKSLASGVISTVASGDMTVTATPAIPRASRSIAREIFS